jgi:hypothetical protein
VLGLSAFDRPHPQLQCQRAIEALLFDYYVDEQTSISESGYNSEPQAKSIGYISKDSGANVKVGLFTDDNYKEISAVVFSSLGSWGKVRALADDRNALTIFHTVHDNPFSLGFRPIVNKTIKAEYTETILDGLRVYHNPFASYPLRPDIFRSPEVFQTYFSEADQEWVQECSSRNLLFRSCMILKIKKEL